MAITGTLGGEDARFGILDYLVLGLTLCVSSGIGIYYRFTGGKQKTAEEYLLGDKKMSVLPVAFSLMASFMSAITLLGVTQENYTYGTQFVVINISYFLATPIAAYVYLPVFFRMQNASAYAYLERRFGYTTRLVASLAFTIQMTLYMGIVVYAPALALSTVTGLSYLGSVFAVGCVCTFYSTLGGMKAVLVTDVFQSLLMFAAVFSVVIAGTLQVGGLSEVFRRAYEGGRIQFDDISPDPTVRHTVWTQAIGGIFIYLSLYGVNQAQVQRLLSIQDLKRAQQALWLQWPILTVLSISTSLAGVVIYTYYQGCDPVLAGRIKTGGQLLPLFVVETMSHHPGLSGLFVSGIFSGSLSTVSSAINSLAAVTLEDYIKPISTFPCCQTLKTLIEERTTLILKLLALFYGFLCVALTFIVDALGSGMLQAALSIFGIVGGPLLGLFTLGMVVKSSNQLGALSGFISSIALAFWMSFGQPRPMPKKLSLSTDNCLNKNISMPLIIQPEIVTQFKDVTGEDDKSENYFYLYRISYAWYAFIGFSLTIIIGTLCSCIFKKFYYSHITKQHEPDYKVDANLFITPLREKLIKTQRKKEKSKNLAMCNSNGRSNNDVTFNELKTHDDEEEILESQQK